MPFGNLGYLDGLMHNNNNNNNRKASRFSETALGWALLVFVVHI